MKLSEYVRQKLIPDYFTSVTCIALAMAVIGTVFEPDVRFGYGVLFSPLIYGLVASLIQLVGYSPRELSTRQAAVRQVLQLALMEVGIMGVLHWAGALTSTGITIALALSIPIIYAVVMAVTWMSDRRTTEAVNSALKRLQSHGGETGDAP